MEKESLNLAIHDLLLTKDMNLNDIPDIALYMDQLTTLFDQNLAHKKRNTTDKLLTKTMINNYTKSKLLMPADKKKYSKNHIVLMLLLYELKQISTMEDIQSLFSMIHAEDNPDFIKELYQTYLECHTQITGDFSEHVYSIFDTITEKINENPFFQNESNSSDNTQNLLMALLLFQSGVHYKRLAEKIIDDLF